MPKKIDLKIDDLIKGTEFKKTREFIRTDKPSRRKMYIEIYSFTDKDLISKLPIKEELKTDTPKKGKVEYDVASREIIFLKLSDMTIPEQHGYELIRIKEYLEKYGDDVVDINRIIKKVDYKYGKDLISFTDTPIRIYLLCESNKIVGYIGIAFKSLVNEETNDIIYYGGDITNIGYNKNTMGKISEIVDNLSTTEPFTKLPIMRLDNDLREHLIITKWSRKGLGYMPQIYNDLSSETLILYYNKIPIKIGTNVEEREAWERGFKENFKYKWKYDHILHFEEGMSEEEKYLIKIVDQTNMDSVCKDECATTYRRLVAEDNEHTKQIINDYYNRLQSVSIELAQFSVWGYMLGYNREHTRQISHDDENGNNNNEEDSQQRIDEEACESCETSYGNDDCRNCEHYNG